MLEVKLRNIFENVQKSTSSHQKYVKTLSNIYNSVPFEDFLSEFFKFISILLQKPIGEATQEVQNCFTFCAIFLSYIIDQNSKNDEECDASHPFLRRLLQELLKYHDLDYVQVRFRTCQFIATLLLNISEGVSVDNDLCDDIQNAMLKRITELKTNIRVQAVSALGRLQDTSNNNCPVMKAYIAALGDPSSLVRKEVLNNIASCPLTYRLIVKRIYDIDHTVRLSAFAKLTLIEPKIFRITVRQVIVLAGINEQNKAARNSFVKMLIKWLSSYEHDYMKLLNALKLDADEEDFKQTTFIWEKILDIFYAIKPVKEIIVDLQLDNNNLVTSDRLSIEVMMYWYHLLNYLESTKNQPEYYEMIKPEPLPLSDFIAGYIKQETSSKLDNWEHFKFQQILHKLFQIVGKIDLADEAIKNAFYTLTTKTMTEIKLDNFVLTELINILKKIFPDMEQFSKKIFSVVTDIREPLVERGPDPYLVREKDFKVAQVHVKMLIVDAEIQEAASKQKFLIANAKVQERAQLEEKLKDLQQNFVVNPKVRIVRNDVKTTLQCLDTVIALLQNTEMEILPPSITQFKQEFVETCTEVTNSELYYKIMKFYALYALSDKQFAFDKIEILCSPIIAYCLITQYDKATLLLSMKAFSDLLCIYGPNIINLDGSVETNLKHASRRLLYNQTQSDISDEINLENISCGTIINIILDVMNDEMQDVREEATIAICRLVERGLVVSSSLISRLLLQMFNPLTEKQDQKIQQLLGFSITWYAQTIKGSANILEKAIIPVLLIIGNAPKTSPLSDINISNILQFLAALTRIKRNEFCNSHKHLTYSIFENILKKPEDKCNYILSMMLQYLDEPDDQIIIAEFRKLIENSLKVVSDKQVIKYLSKYSRKLAGYSVSTCRVTGVSIATRASCQVNESNMEQEQIAVEHYSINSCRATNSSVSNNRDIENLLTNEQNRTGNDSISVQRRNSSKKGKYNSVNNFTENNASDSALVVSGVNQRSLKCSTTSQTQRKRNETDLDSSRSSIMNSDLDGDFRKKGWRKRKRTNILQMVRKENLQEKLQITNSVDEISRCLEDIDADKQTSSSNLSENVRSNEIRKPVASDPDESQRQSRLTKKSMENTPANYQLRSSISNNNTSEVSRTPTSFTPKNKIKKTRSNTNLKNSLRESTRQGSSGQLKRGKNSVNSTQKKNNLKVRMTLRNHSATLNLAKNSKIRPKRIAKSKTSESECSSPSLKETAKKKQKISRK